MRPEIAHAVSAYVAEKTAEVDLCGSFNGKYVKCEACGFLCLVHDIEVLTVYSRELLLCGQCRNRALTFLLSIVVTKLDPHRKAGTSVEGSDARMTIPWKSSVAELDMVNKAEQAEDPLKPGRE